jgi:tryptophan halogenase
MRVVIAGGGAAGWIAAAVLQARFNPSEKVPAQASAQMQGHVQEQAQGREQERRGGISIVVVSSPDAPRIGVGEATIPTIRNLFSSVGLCERDVFSACQGTVKHAIRFDGWGGAGHQFWHPFHRATQGAMRDAFTGWIGAGSGFDFAKHVSAQIALIDPPQAPRPLAGMDYSGLVPYAYHLDAESLADVLRSRSMRSGVRHVLGHITGVERDNGLVKALHLRDAQKVPGDLFIDCTGFASLLDQDTDWLDQSPHLICDRAVVMQVPNHPSGPQPFTRAQAMTAGWSWDIALQNRRGCGYVHASRHIDPTTAEAELRTALGPTAADLPARHIQFKVGRKRAAWAGNVVSMGLAAGFLEPLESTGLFFADLSARLLAEFFPPTPDAAGAIALSQTYNDILATTHDEVLDFIVAHYVLARRRDTPFWRDASRHERMPQTLRHLLARWQLRPPSQFDFQNAFSPFSHWNYEFLLAGNGWRPEQAGPGNLGQVVSGDGLGSGSGAVSGLRGPVTASVTGSAACRDFVPSNELKTLPPMHAFMKQMGQKHP